MAMQLFEAQMQDTIQTKMLLITLGGQPSPSLALPGKYLPSFILLFDFIKYFSDICSQALWDNSEFYLEMKLHVKEKVQQNPWNLMIPLKEFGELQAQPLH